MKKGAGNLEAILILAVVVFIFLASPRGSTPPPATGSNPVGGWLPGPSLFGGGSSSSGNTSSGGNYTSRGLSLGSGNASYAYQPYQEYVTLRNDGDTTIDVTGWQLRNGKDKRTYDQGGMLQRYSADIAAIPQATFLLSPTGGSTMRDVTLAPGEQAILTTGSIGAQTPYKITSFKENACTGYIGGLNDYSFAPPLSSSCPDPSNEPGFSSLDTQCRSFVRSMYSCTTPKFDRTDNNGETCETCINGTRLSSSCAAFIKSHFSYQGCIAYHAGDKNFNSGRTWRIFLNHPWEMWAPDYESIELFDRSGNLVSSTSY